MKLGVAAFSAVALLATSGCSLFTRQNARAALDVTHVVCIIARAESDDATVARICGVEAVLYPEMKRILEEQRAASRRFAATMSNAVKPDAGAP